MHSPSGRAIYALPFLLLRSSWTFAHFLPDNAPYRRMPRILLLHRQTTRGVQIARCNHIHMTNNNNINITRPSRNITASRRIKPIRSFSAADAAVPKFSSPSSSLSSHSRHPSGDGTRGLPGILGIPGTLGANGEAAVGAAVAAAVAAVGAVAVVGAVGNVAR